MTRKKIDLCVTRAMALAIRRDYQRGSTTKALAELYGYARSTIGLIIAGKHAYTAGMVDIARPIGRPCSHRDRRCVHRTVARGDRSREYQLRGNRRRSQASTAAMVDGER